MERGLLGLRCDLVRLELGLVRNVVVLNLREGLCELLALAPLDVGAGVESGLTHGRLRNLQLQVTEHRAASARVHGRGACLCLALLHLGLFLLCQVAARPGLSFNLSHELLGRIIVSQRRQTP